MNYRIYKDVSGFEYVTTTTENKLFDVISTISKDTHILIIKHHIKEDMDVPYFCGYVENFFYKEQAKRKVKSK